MKDLNIVAIDINGKIVYLQVTYEQRIHKIVSCC